jgi:hypothetical protein
MGAVADGQEPPLRLVAGPHPVLAGPLGRGATEMIIVDLWRAGRGPPMPGDLDRTPVAVVDHDHLLISAQRGCDFIRMRRLAIAITSA